MRCGVTLLAGLLLSGGVLLGGCQGSHEPDEQAYIMAVGMDQASEPGKIKVSYQIATSGGGKESGASPSAGPITNMTVITIDNTYVPDSRNLLKSIVALTPTLVHVKMVVVGEDLARQGIGDTIGVIKRMREYRGSMFVAVCHGTAEDFLRANKPLFAMSPAKYYELMMVSARESNYYLNSDLHYVYTRMKSFSSDAYIQLVGVNPADLSDQQSGTPPPGQRSEEYKAGEIPRKGGNPVEFAGTAIFRGDKMVGILTTEQTRMLSILLGNFHGGFLEVADPLQPEQTVNVALRLGSSPNFRAEIVDGQAKVAVAVLLEGSINTIPSGVNYENAAYRPLLEAVISQTVEQSLTDTIHYMQQMHSDAAGFGNYFRGKFSTQEEFMTFNWLQDKYPRADISVHVTTILRRSELMQRTAPIID